MRGPAVTFRSADEAAAALALAGPEGVTLLSVPGAAAFPGGRTVAAVIARAAAAHPGVPFVAVLDCGVGPGLALDAIRAGWRCLVLARSLPAFARVAAAGAEVGAVLLGTAPPALDLGRLDLRRAGGRAVLARWLVGQATTIP